MSKRTDTIRNLFATTPSETLSADNIGQALPRVSSGSVRSVKESFSGIERENEDLRAQLTNGVAVVELDPTLIDPSPITDRIVDWNETSFVALKESIHERGQEIPVLVRVSPSSPERYQSAYGHRRIRAALELGIRVKAVVRKLSDEELVVAQGVENSARQDLSFVERAQFALRLEDAGHSRAVIQSALSIDRAEASKLLSVARSIPPDLIVAIGRAPKIGRGRWQAFADLLGRDDAVIKARSAIASTDLVSQDSDARFVSIFDATRLSLERSQPRQGSVNIVSTKGRDIANVLTSKKELRLSVDRSKNSGFADFLIDRLPELFERYIAEHPEEEAAS